MASPRIFTIPASAPFMRVLIRALVDNKLGLGFPVAKDPLRLADATLYLPTRRACRLARDLFLEVTGGSAAILPRIVPIGDVDEDEIVFAQAAAGISAAEALALPPELGGLERRMLLTQLVLKWAAAPEVRTAEGVPLVASNPASALALADALARLMDDMTTRQVPWSKLDGLVPDNLDQYWQYTLRFLKIAREIWPTILTERGAIEPADRRDRLIAAEAKRLAERHDGPVIAAGSTGSMPATAELIATIAKLPHGAVVLPGLDTDLDDTSWALIDGANDTKERDGAAPAVGHPQFAMAALLRKIGIARAKVVELASAEPYGREAFVSEALRPAAATERWQERLAQPDFCVHVERALGSISVLEAANAEEEALAIAIALREVMQEPDKTAALITPDRGLARRVIAALERWNVAVDDSGGDALPVTPAGIFARLTADAALGGLTPVTLLALLKHPLLRLGAGPDAHAAAVRTLEAAVLRGPRPRAGTGGLRSALAAFRVELDKFRRKEPSELHWSDPRTHLGDRELDAAEALVARLGSALAPLEEIGARPMPFADIAARHRDAVEALGCDHKDRVVAFGGPDGEMLDAAFVEIERYRHEASLAVAPADYLELFQTAISDRVVRRHERPGVRVRIYGLLEARLQSVDRVVLGGLAEGTWPPETRSDPWLSRPMRLDLGLDLPERRISLSAHDFAQALGAPEAILAWSAKIAGAPTVTSRFVQRMAAVAGPDRWQVARERGERYLALARALDLPPVVQRGERPAPKPPRAARPTRFSVTEIEHWLRDPYTIYASRILGLRELDPIDLAPGAADRGTLIHGAVGDFTKTFAAALPDDPERTLIELGREKFTAMEAYPEARAFWWPRFLRIARWFSAWERDRRKDIAQLYAEIRGEIAIQLGERTLKLSARADRIERRADGRYTILDYKTGTVPSPKQVSTGMSPQLTLEAAILRAGGFDGVPPGPVAALTYVSLKGGEPAGREEPIDFKQGDANLHAAHALSKLTEVAEKFEREDQPYLPLILPMWKNRYGTYDHLARVKEWSVGEHEEEPF
jgi:ATP-dependent helicase/nuclease subunit B